MSDQTPEVDGAQVRAVLSALEKLPRYDGVSFRGDTADAVARPRQTIVSQGLVASSLDICVATENFTTNGLLAIIGNLGRAVHSVSAKPFEKEVVFLPGTMFMVLESWTAFEIPVTLVEQLDPDRVPGTPPKTSLEEIRQLVVTHVDKARRRAPVAGATPGKFQGGLA